MSKSEIKDLKDKIKSLEVKIKIIEVLLSRHIPDYPNEILKVYWTLGDDKS